LNAKKLVLVDPAAIPGMSDGYKGPHEPIALSIIGGYALQRNIPTSIVCATEKNPFDSVNRILLQEPTHVGIGAFLYNLPHALRLAGAIKAIDPKVVIILGGNGVTVDAEELSLDPHLDYVVRGEGVYAVSDLIEDAPPRGRVFSKGHLVADNPLRTAPDDIPLPLRTEETTAGRTRPDLSYPSQEDQRYGSVWTITGCTNRCKYCQTQEVFPGSVLFRDPGKVFEEVEDCRDRFGINLFFLTDPVAFGGITGLRNGHGMACATLLGKTGANFHALTRLDMPDEYWDILALAGVTKVAVGIESMVMDGVKDGIGAMRFEKIEEYGSKAASRGILLRALFMTGYAGQSLEQIEREIEMLSKLRGPTDIRISWLTPFDKSARERQELFETGAVYTADISRWNGHYPVYRISGVETIADFQALHLRMYQAFYGSGNADEAARERIKIRPGLIKSYQWFNRNVLHKMETGINV
jgi:anaerobic magnesium-protoporphyrin IX monomethyl ester cyclase